MQGQRRVRALGGLAAHQISRYFPAMKIVDPQTGLAYIEKRRRRYNEENEPRELTFSCYRRYSFLRRERTREWFCDALEKARTKFGIHILAYVIMPEHVHLLVWPAAARAHTVHEAPVEIQASKAPATQATTDVISPFL
jgi:hypothetical protein